MDKRRFIEVSILFYLIALLTPIFIQVEFIGIHAIVFGWYGFAVREIPIIVSWLANVFYILNLISLKFSGRCFQIILSSITVISGFFSFFIRESIMALGNADYMLMNIGFFFWISSFITLLIGQLQKNRTGSKMILMKYNPNWEKNFKKISVLLSENLGDSILNIEHVGSTSIPGLKAKPIIDIDIVYNSQSDFESIKSNFESIGYYHNGNQGMKGREVFKRASESNHEILDSITHHLYVCHEDSEELKRHLLFRDHLRSNESARKEYEKIKLSLAEKANQDKKTYAELKEQEATAFIQECIKKEKENGK